MPWKPLRFPASSAGCPSAIPLLHLHGTHSHTHTLLRCRDFVHVHFFTFKSGMWVIFSLFCSQKTVWTKEEYSLGCTSCTRCAIYKQMQGNGSYIMEMNALYLNLLYTGGPTLLIILYIFLPSLQDAAIIKKSLSKKPGSKAHFSGEGIESESDSAPLSSSALLAKMRDRNYLRLPSSQREGAEELEEDEDGSGAPRTRSSPAPPTEHDELLVDLRNFIAFQARVDGQATTQEVLEYFKPRLSQRQAPVFRELLRSICDFRRTSGQEGIWRLKEQFRWVNLDCTVYTQYSSARNVLIASLKINLLEIHVVLLFSVKWRCLFPDITTSVVTLQAEHIKCLQFKEIYCWEAILLYKGPYVCWLARVYQLIYSLEG